MKDYKTSLRLITTVENYIKSYLDQYIQMGGDMETQIKEAVKNRLGIDIDYCRFTVIQPYYDHTSVDYPIENGSWSYPITLVSVIIGDRCFTIMTDNQRTSLESRNDPDDWD